MSRREMKCTHSQGCTPIMGSRSFALCPYFVPIDEAFRRSRDGWRHARFVYAISLPPQTPPDELNRKEPVSQERVQRRLAAILFADVVGYSRLIGQDDVGTWRLHAWTIWTPKREWRAAPVRCFFPGSNSGQHHGDVRQHLAQRAHRS